MTRQIGLWFIVMLSAFGQTVTARRAATDFSECGGRIQSIFAIGLNGIPESFMAGDVLPTEVGGVSVGQDWIRNTGSVAFPVAAERQRVPYYILGARNFGSYQQINILVVPSSAPPDCCPTFIGETVFVQPTGAGIALPPCYSSVPRSPFFLGADRVVRGAFRAADFREITQIQPAEPGDWLSFYTDWPLLKPIPGTAGFDWSRPTPSSPLYPAAFPEDHPSVVFWSAGRVSLARPSFVGLAPGQFGLIQVNVQVPEDLASDEVEIQLWIPETPRVKLPVTLRPRIQAVTGNRARDGVVTLWGVRFAAAGGNVVTARRLGFPDVVLTSAVGGEWWDR